MSPVPPPPAGTFIPSDDWTDDPSFDLSPNAANLALHSSPSPSSSSSQRSSVSRSHTSSPLRQSFSGGSSSRGPRLKKQPEVELDSLDDDFDLPAGDLSPLPSTSPRSKCGQPTRSRTASSSSSIMRTVIAQGPQGVGTITKLGTIPASTTGALIGTVNARARALERNWEADVDLDDFDEAFGQHKGGTVKLKGGLTTLEGLSGGGKGRRMTISPPKKQLPGADALDDFLDLEDEDQVTLKAGSTLKAMLPPPKPKSKSSLQATTPAQHPAGFDDAELETDFALPLNLTNLKLATQSSLKMPKRRPRDSTVSTANTESWDSPGASSITSGKKWGWGSEDSPTNKMLSETSATSVSDGSAEKDHRKGRDEDMDEEEDLELGLVFEPAFFSVSRANELNSILDRKRRPQYAPQPETSFGPRRGCGDDSFEDGLMLDEPGVELSRHKLRAQKRARDHAPSVPRKGQPAKSVVKEREKAWEKHREQGWGRNTPVPGAREKTQSGMMTIPLQGTLPRERTQSSLGISLRSHSVSTVSRESKEVSFSGREKEAMRSRSGHLLNNMPPPLPPIPASQPVPPSSSSRLRHQKSHYHIAAPPQSPSLTRKQSLASLQDALSDRNFSTQRFEALSPPPLPSNRYHNSTSRLTMPTSSSRAKTRPPVSSIFPKHDLETSTSSTSSVLPTESTSSTRTRMYSTPMPARVVDIPKRSRGYGDGTELDSIDDLRIGEDTGHTITQKGMASLGLGKPVRREHDSSNRSTLLQKEKPQEEKRKKSGTQLATRKFKKRGAGLIKHLGGADKKKVIGEMTWNPATLRWEGNESVLRDFDTISSSRPALITHYTGSSVGGVTSPVTSVSSITAPRIVGDMQFDPVKMKWISILSPDEDEPDPFESMADDEDEETGGGTIRAGAGRRFVPIGSGGSMAASSSTWSQRMASESSMATSVASWEERTRPDVGVVISNELWLECKSAEERHKKEMRGWATRVPQGSGEIRERERREEKRLWEIRHLAMKS